MYNEYNLGFDDFDIVEEGFFCENTEHTVRDLLASIRTNVREKYTTTAAAHELFDKICDEIVGFNELLLEMINAHRDYRAGNISKEDMLAVMIPSIRELKTGCTALKLVPDSAFGDGNDITEEEVAAIKELLVGCRTIVEERIQELENYPGTDWEGKAGTIMHGSEGFLESLFDEDDYAYEAFGRSGRAKSASAIRKSPDAKNANQYFKQAKKLYSLGDKQNAASALKKAKTLYTKCLKAAQGLRGARDVKRTDYDMISNREYKSTQYARPALVAYFEDRIDACDALVLQWSNKAGKSSYKETKAMLKSERKEARSNRKEARREAKAAKKAAKESYALAEFYGFADEMDMYAMEADLGISFENYNSYEEALEDIAIENTVQMMLIEDGFGDEF